MVSVLTFDDDSFSVVSTGSDQKAISNFFFNTNKKGGFQFYCKHPWLVLCPFPSGRKRANFNQSFPSTNVPPPFWNWPALLKRFAIEKLGWLGVRKTCLLLVLDLQCFSPVTIEKLGWLGVRNTCLLLVLDLQCFSPVAIEKLGWLGVRNTCLLLVLDLQCFSPITRQNKVYTGRSRAAMIWSVRGVTGQFD